MKSNVVYRITCAVNGKSYVGRTTDELRRKRDHFGSLRSGKHRNAHLQSAFKKYGETSFTWHVIGRFATVDEAQREEQWFIDRCWPLDLLFNLTQSSFGGGVPGRVVSAATRERNSRAMTLRMANPALRQRISECRTGKPLSEEHKQKLRAAKARAREERFGANLAA